MQRLSELEKAAVIHTADEALSDALKAYKLHGQHFSTYSQNEMQKHYRTDFFVKAECDPDYLKEMVRNYKRFIRTRYIFDTPTPQTENNCSQR